MRGERGRRSYLDKILDRKPFLKILKDQGLARIALHTDQGTFVLERLIKSINRKQQGLDWEQDYMDEVQKILKELPFESNTDYGPICRQYDARLKYYRCYDCESAGIGGCFCEGCFKEEIHRHHDFIQLFAAYYCDCGDTSVMNSDSFCEKHQKGSAFKVSCSQVQYSQDLEIQVEFLLHLGLEINKIKRTYEEERRRRCLEYYLLIQTLKFLFFIMKKSHKNKQFVAKIMFQQFRGVYQHDEKIIIQNLLTINPSVQINQAFTYLMVELYALPDYRPEIIKLFWKLMTTPNIVPGSFLKYASLQNHLMSDVKTIVQLMERNQIQPFSVHDMNIDNASKKVEAFILIHKIMQKHTSYPDYLELVLSKKKRDFLHLQLSQTIDTRNRINNGQDHEITRLIDSYVVFSTNMIKGVNKLSQKNKFLRQILQDSYKTINDKISHKETYMQAMYTHILFALSFFSLLDFDLSKLEKLSSEQLFQIIGEQKNKSHKDFLLQNKDRIQKVREIITLTLQLTSDRENKIQLCFYSLFFKIMLICQQKIQNQLGQSFLFNTIDSYTVTLCRDILYSLETDVPQTIISCFLQNMSETVRNKISAFASQLLYLNAQSGLKAQADAIKKWFPNWIQIKNNYQINSTNPSIKAEKDVTTSEYSSRISFSSYLVYQQLQQRQKKWDLKTSNSRNRVSLLEFFFNEKFIIKLETFSAILTQDTQRGIKVYDQISDIIHLSALLFSETKKQQYKAIIDSLLSFFQKNQTLLQNPGRQRQTLQFIQLIFGSKSISVQGRNSISECKRQKVKDAKLARIKQLQEKMLKKVSHNSQIEHKSDKSCIICRQSNNLMTICKVNYNSILANSHFNNDQSILLLTSCAHYLHQKCCIKKIKSYKVIDSHQERNNCTVQEFSCPYCRQQGNLLLPIIDESCQNALTDRLIDEHIKVVEKTIYFFYRLQFEQNPHVVKDKSADQLIFESIVYQMYLYFSFSPKNYALSMLPATKSFLDIFRWKIHRGIHLKIDPINIMVSNDRFFKLQEIIILVLFYDIELKNQLIEELTHKLKQVSFVGCSDQQIELLQLFAGLLGVESISYSDVQRTEQLKWFTLPEKLSDLQALYKKCQYCSKKKNALTTKMEICLICGHKACSMCWSYRKAKHSRHGGFGCRIQASTGIAIVEFKWTARISLYTDQFDNPFPRYKLRPHFSNSYIFNKTRYDKIVNSVFTGNYLSSSLQNNRPSRLMRNEREDLIPRGDGTNWNSYYIDNVHVAGNVRQFRCRGIRPGRGGRSRGQFMRRQQRQFRQDIRIQRDRQEIQDRIQRRNRSERQEYERYDRQGMRLERGVRQEQGEGPSQSQSQSSDRRQRVQIQQPAEQIIDPNLMSEESDIEIECWMIRNQHRNQC